jgi:DNA-binding XRE family transcriptional regulator
MGATKNIEKQFIGDVAKKIRQARGLSQAKAAMEADIGLETWRTMEQGYISKSEYSPARGKVTAWINKHKHFIRSGGVKNAAEETTE